MNLNSIVCWLVNHHQPAKTHFEKEGEETYCLRCGVTLLAGRYLGQPTLIVKPKFLDGKDA